MYYSLKYLEVNGYITSYWGDEYSDGRRKYYQVTKAGKVLYNTNKRHRNYAKRVLEKLL